MFKKLKDKLAEEVKSSPQRIQQFAQAAQAAVTSASSSISDITNSDLFSIGDNDSSQQNHSKPTLARTRDDFENVPLDQTKTLQPTPENADVVHRQDLSDNSRQRRLSTSSFTSDVSFRLPYYESPSMYHLQSDMDVSASEAEERGLSGGAVNLDRVTKEQLYAVYKRTQERYSKYRTQYADLARHYKLLEKENAKARSVLVETQDKALRRMSELREQCSLEQSAKAHLEKALRAEIEEKIMKIEALNTKISLLQQMDNDAQNGNNKNCNEAEKQLIDLSSDNKSTEILNSKIQNMEQLLNKYKDSLKSYKEQNAEMSAQIQMLSSEIKNKTCEIEELKHNTDMLNAAKLKINELTESNEHLQNSINSYEFSKVKEISKLELDLQNANDEIKQLMAKIEIFNKREEDYAISLAENKLSIHKELESKENEIKSLKKSLTASHQELQSTNIIVNEYKSKLAIMEEEKSNLKNIIADFDTHKAQSLQMETQLTELTQKCKNFEQLKIKLNEENKCLKLQISQETAEKLAMIDRNNYLSQRNAHIVEENEKKSAQIKDLENQLEIVKKNSDFEEKKVLLEKQLIHEKEELLKEVNTWKSKCTVLETEIQEEKEELVKLQTEIEYLIANHDQIRSENLILHNTVLKLKTDNNELLNKNKNTCQLFKNYKNLLNKVSELKQYINFISVDMKKIKNLENDLLFLKNSITNLSNNYANIHVEHEKFKELYSVSESERENINFKYEKCLDELKEMGELKIKLDKLQMEYVESQNQLQNNKAEYLDVNNEITNLKNKNQSLMATIRSLEAENFSFKEENINMSNEYEACINELKFMEQIKNDFEILEINCSETQKELENFKDKNSLLSREIDEVKDENDILNVKIQNSESENLSLQDKIISLTNEYDACVNELKQLDEVKFNFEKLQSENHITQAELKNIKENYSLILSELETLKSENELLRPKTQFLESENSLIKEKLLHYTNLYEATINDLNHVKNITNADDTNSVCNNDNKISNIKKNDNVLIVKLASNEPEDFHVGLAELNIVQDNNTIIFKLVTPEEIGLVKRELDEQKILFNTIQDQNKKNIQENSSLKSVIEDLNNSVIELQKEIDESKCQEKKDEPEKASRRSIIKENETENSKLNNNTEQLKTNGSEDYKTLKNENDVVKEENRRLQSDIEGLQTYLKKISKENSLLNDKIRDFIASSDNSPEKHENLLHDVEFLKTEIQTGKDKIENLARENTFLVEENLELKDQLHSQKRDDNTETKIITEESRNIHSNFDKLLKEKGVLEQKVSELESVNTSITKNMQAMHQSNEKLQHSNEKLGRRLDEALVSLRHLHSLQESTELEYLKNILYEYLTGPGTHSLTLAKVLSAVVKFDDGQTQLVLQKEKERQGLLRQLGLT